MRSITNICCLCGMAAKDGDPITREHHPPKQFYPKSMRDGLNLWTKVPTHKSCNAKNKLDEEYFYHALYPLVANANPTIACVILDDIKRRAKQPQTPALLRKILQTARVRTEGGLELPPSVVQLDVDSYRLEQVAIKIGRCLFFRDHQRIMPYENCKDIQLFEREEDVPELYSLSWSLSKVNVNDLAASESGDLISAPDVDAGQAITACRQVFDYRPAFIAEERLHLYSLRFWESFMYCMAFQSPDKFSDEGRTE